MTMDFRYILLCLSILFAFGGTARLALTQPSDEQIETLLAASAIPTDNAEGFGKYLRPLGTETWNGHDPEMRELVLRFYAMTPCGAPEDKGLCRQARELLIGGGDRVALYLEKQAELNLEEGWPNEWTYFLALGYTESDEAVRYLSAKLDQAQDAETRGMSARALGETRRPEIIPRMLAFIENGDRNLQSVAVGALEKIRAKHGSLPPGVAQRLAAAKATLQ
jgi:hypothetical protein